MSPRRDGAVLVDLAHMMTSIPVRAAAVLAAVALFAGSANTGLAMPEQSDQSGETSPTYQVLRQDVIINADIWARKPEMMAAGLGFTTIEGVPNLGTSDVALSKTLAVLAGGTWNNVTCTNGQTPPLSSFTSAATPAGIRETFGQNVYYADGLPVGPEKPDDRDLRALPALGELPGGITGAQAGSPPIRACRVERSSPPEVRYRLRPLNSSPAGTVPVQTVATMSPSTTSASIT
jgi:hypothetical protein